MKKSIRIAITLLAGISLLILAGCPKSVEKNETGPGGLPKGIVEEGEAPAMGPDFPVYPGAVQKAAKVFVTPDRIEAVATWYGDLLGVVPEIRDQARITRTFVTDVYEVTLLPYSDETGSGTEINFTLLDVAH